MPFDLPNGFQNLTFDDGDLGRRYQPTATGRGGHLPLPPGQGVRQTLLRYVMPFSSLTLDIKHPVAVALRSLNVLVADVGAKVTSPDLQEGAPRQVDQATYFNFTASDVPANKTIELAMTNLPLDPRRRRTRPCRPNSPWLAVGVAGLAALGLLGVLFFAVRQRRQAADAEAKATMSLRRCHHRERSGRLTAQAPGLDSGRLPNWTTVMRRARSTKPTTAADEAS